LPVLKFKEDGMLDENYIKKISDKVPFSINQYNKSNYKEIKAWILEKDAYIDGRFVIWGEVKCVCIVEPTGNIYSATMTLEETKNSFKKLYNTFFSVVRKQ